ncbi:PD-(D/E)XK nuclease family protein [Catellicoccus marimammalium]|uniref:Exonuclease RexB n=1 Tax=Catellicoccus marimammalium M35/04/3 TaxID=1234409 RepID=K8ZLH6_9ENTE|nr:PD-(D/E)XK nuclease family protein [Catellicoccus marimammalium]EKU27413.1 exonuclease RexB [Catellicoccus marimammalium M35/04/3]
MSLLYIYGDRSHQHLQMMMQEKEKFCGAKAWLQEKEHQVCFLVPNNLKFEGEVAILQEYAQGESYDFISNLSLSVFSFERLAWYLLEEDHTPKISQSGLQMLLRKQMLEIEKDTTEDKYTHLKPLFNKKGFIEKVLDLFLEWIEGQLTPELLLDYLSLAEEASLNEETLKELIYLYQNFLQVSQGYSFNNHQLLAQLKEYLQTHSLNHYQFYVYGFQRFTAEELEILSLLAKRSQLIVSVISPDHPLTGSMSSLYESQKQLAKRLAILAEEPYPLCFLAPKEEYPLASMSQVWQTFDEGKTSNYSLPQSVMLWKAEDELAEVEQVARTIYQLVREENYRYRDITIFTRNLEGYHSHFAPIFHKYQIPYHLGESQNMAHHSLTILLESLFKIEQYPHQAQFVFDFLKTGLVRPTYEEIWSEQEKEQYEKDQQTQALEEYQAAFTMEEEKEEVQNRELTDFVSFEEWSQWISLAEIFMETSGYDGRDWQKEEFPYRGSQLKEGDEKAIAKLTEAITYVARFVRQLLADIHQIFAEKNTYREVLQALYQQLLSWHVLEELQKEEVDKNEEVWNQFVALVEEMNQLLGAYPYQKEENLFFELFIEGLRSRTYSSIPNTVDEVHIADIMRPRMVKTKVCFIIGGDELHLPKVMSNDTLLSDEERMHLTTYLEDYPQCYLGKDTITMMNHEYYHAYLAMTTAKEKLYLSYAQSKGEMSPYYQWMKELGVETKSIFLFPQNGTFQKEYLANGQQNNAVALTLYRKEQTGIFPLDPTWQKCLTSCQQKFPTLWQGLFLENQAESLRKDQIFDYYDEPFGKEHQFITSVSQLSGYLTCPYRYYLQKGLQLEPLEEYQPDYRMHGNFLHEALDVLMKELRQRKQNFHVLSTQELYDLCQSVLKELEGEKIYSVYQANEKNRFENQQLKRLFQNVCAILHYEMEIQEDIQYEDSLTEIRFVPERDKIYPNQLIAPNLSIHTEDETGKEVPITIGLKGRIDRLDLLKVGKERYYQLLDYKSKAKKLRANGVDVGDALQLLTYIAVLQENQEALRQAFSLPKEEVEEIHLDGAYFVPLENNDLQEKDQIKISSQIRWEGIALKEGLPKEKEVYHLLGSPKKEYAAGLTEEQMTQLVEKNKADIKQAVQNIYDGDCSIRPRNEKSCQHCPFHSICQFSTETNQYQKGSSVQNVDELFEKLKKGKE